MWSVLVTKNTGITVDTSTGSGTQVLVPYYYHTSVCSSKVAKIEYRYGEQLNIPGLVLSCPAAAAAESENLRPPAEIEDTKSFLMQKGKSTISLVTYRYSFR